MAIKHIDVYNNINQKIIEYNNQTSNTLVNLLSQPNGTYYCYITSDDKIEVIKLIKIE